MSITIQEVLQIPVFKEAYLLTGDTGLKNEILFTTIMDIPNLTEWLHGGELICAGVLLEQCLSEQFFKDLKGKNIAGIVTKLKFTRHMTDCQKKLCSQIGLPVIIVPDHYNWSELMNPVVETIIRNQYDIITETQKFHDILMECLLQNESMKIICEKVRQTSGLSVAIINSGLTLLSYSKDLQWDHIINGISHHNLIPKNNLSVTVDGARIPGYQFKNHYLTVQNKKLFLYEINQANVRYGYITIAVDQDINQLTTQEIMKVQQLSLITALSMSKRNAVDSATRKYNNLLLDEILQASSIDDTALEHISRSLGVQLETNYYIAMMHGDTKSSEDVLLRNQNTDQFYRTLKRDLSYFKKLLLFEYAENFIIFFGESYPVLEAALEKIDVIYKETFNTKKTFIGVSLLHPFIKAKLAYQQALQALNYAEKHSRNNCCFYSDLGILRFFMDNKNELSMEYLREIHNRYIRPVKDYDRQNHTKLFETFTTYLNQNCSKVKTEKALYIHKNTLLARINTIEKITDCDLSTSEDLFNLQMAVKIDYLLEEWIK